MFYLFHAFSPLGKGSKKNCELMINKMVDKGYERKQFFIVNEEEYTEIITDQHTF